MPPCKQLASHVSTVSSSMLSACRTVEPAHPLPNLGQPTGIGQLQRTDTVLRSAGSTLPHISELSKCIGDRVLCIFAFL